jgi:hypothetical protein
MGAKDLIELAIKNKSSLSFDYKNHPRFVTSHVLGYKKNILHCFAYQYDGKSSSSNLIKLNSKDNWRCFEVNQMKNIIIIENKFETHNSYSKTQTCIDRIISQI